MVFRNILKTKSHNSNEDGFIILTIPVVLALFGFFVTAMVNDTKPNQFFFEANTQKGMESVRLALAAYAHRNYRVPCPGDPAVAPTEMGEQAITTGICDRWTGILPFRELGLPESAAKDEWGNYFTYKVSPDFTRVLTNADFSPIGDPADPMLVSQSGSENSLHELCRTPNWASWANEYRKSDGTSQLLTTGETINHNIYKANFCCPSNVVSGGAGHLETSSHVGTSGLKELDYGAQGKVKLTMDGIDRDIALWDEKANRNVGNQADWIERTYTRAEAAEFVYNDSLPHGGGNGVGAPHEYGRTENDGKFHNLAAVFEFDQTKTTVRDVTFGLTDLGENNWYEPVQIKLDIYDTPEDPEEEGQLLTTISYVLQLPEATSYSGELSFSLENLIGEPDQEGFFHAGARDERTMTNRELDASEADKLFNKSKDALLEALEDNDLTIDDIEIGKMKVNSTHASIALTDLSFGGADEVINTDLVHEVKDIDGNIESLHAMREEADSYAASNIPHTTEVAANYEAPAYVLISHGSNGEGAFIGNGTTAQYDNILLADENPDETINYQDGKNFRDMPKVNSNDSRTAFDDIVMSDSQVTLYNSLRNGTCEGAQSL